MRIKIDKQDHHLRLKTDLYFEKQTFIISISICFSTRLFICHIRDTRLGIVLRSVESLTVWHHQPNFIKYFTLLRLKKWRVWLHWFFLNWVPGFLFKWDFCKLPWSWNCTWFPWVVRFPWNSFPLHTLK